MARPREFDRNEALQKAVEVFWANGFDATSMTDLQKALGIGRQSLYSTFGDKQQIFEEALASYVSQSEAMFDSSFGDDCGVAEIRAHFQDAAHRLTGGEPRRGCLIMSTGMQCAPHDPRAAALVQRALDVMQASFARALRNAQGRGEVAPELDIEAVAACLTAQNAGMAVLGSSGASAELLGRSADALLDAVVRAPAP